MTDEEIQELGAAGSGFATKYQFRGVGRVCGKPQAFVFDGNDTLQISLSTFRSWFGRSAKHVLTGEVIACKVTHAV